MSDPSSRLWSLSLKSAMVGLILKLLGLSQYLNKVGLATHPQLVNFKKSRKGRKMTFICYDHTEKRNT